MITVQTFQETQAIKDRIFIKRDAGGFHVYQKGDTVPAPKSVPVETCPQVVTPRQIRLALSAAGLRETVETAVAAGSQDLKDWWEYALTIERNNDLIVGMASQLNITSEQLDDLFIAAAAL